MAQTLKIQIKHKELDDPIVYEFHEAEYSIFCSLALIGVDRVEDFLNGDIKNLEFLLTLAIENIINKTYGFLEIEDVHDVYLLATQWLLLIGACLKADSMEVL
jgi:hypothetical protein